MSQGCHFCGESACVAAPGRVTDVLGAQPQSFGAVPATPQPALSAENGIREFVWPCPGARNSAAGRKQLAVQPRKHARRPIIGAQPQDQPAPGLDDAPSLVDQLLHHRLDAPTLGAVAYRRGRPQQGALAHQAQDVHGQRGQLAHQVVGVELARGQPGEVEVGLELGVKLLMRAVVGVQRDDGLRVELLGAQAGGPAFEFDLGNQQLLTLPVDRALDQPVDAPQRPGDAFDAQRLIPHRQALARAGLLPLRLCVGLAPHQHLGLVDAARVPLDQPIDLRLPRLTARLIARLIARLDAAHQRGRIKPRIQPRQDRRVLVGTMPGRSASSRQKPCEPR